METVTKIMIAEDNISILSCYQEILSKDKDVEIVGYAQDGESTIQMYKERKPDILLLDLDLPKKNGLDIINDLSDYETDGKKRNIIAVSGDTLLMHNLFDPKKIYRIIPKADTDEVFEAITDIKKQIHQDNFPDKLWEDTLFKLRLNHCYKSTRLLTDIIKLCFFDFELLQNMQNIYSIMGSRYNCPPKKIQSRLRSCINIANRLFTPEVLSSIFYIDNYNTFVPTRQSIR